MGHTGISEVQLSVWHVSSDPDSCRLLAEILGDSRYIVESFGSVAAADIALEMWSHYPDLIIIEAAEEDDDRFRILTEIVSSPLIDKATILVFVRSPHATGVFFCYHKNAAFFGENAAAPARALLAKLSGLLK